ncbi:MAG: DNRLRE domain-containing protein, partial [Anaerolineaceae bacterium]|nr:DNRLRE domain-containing protein [Anaerolineaceae bacterium]
MKIYKFIITMAFILSVFISPIYEMNHSVFAAGEGCAVNSPSSGNYSVEFCITSPTNASTLSGDINVTSSYSTIGSSPGIQRVIFYLNNEYLLTDFESDYSFLLPTSKFVDGNYALSVVIVMRDGYVFQMGSITVSFSNGNTMTPVNSNTFQIFTSPAHANGQPFMVAAGGDGASGITNSANVVNLINNLNPDMFLYLGDVYNKGTYTEFINWYGNEQTFFGQFKSITNPIVGNHEYENGEAPGYFDYWDNVPDYYSYDAGGWHFIALNSNHSVVPVNSGSAQYQWLQSDLNSNSDKCTVVYFHHPLFNIGPPSSTTELMDIWNLLAQSNVEIALTGHDHTYQRWSPLGINGQPDPNGITQFVAGASGHGVQTISKTDDRVAFFSDANPGALGVLTLALNASGANFSYVNTAGEIIDSGVIPCSTANQDTQPPTIPGNVVVDVVNSTQAVVSWTNSTDNTGVAGYTVYRDGIVIGNVSSGSASFRDIELLPEITYSFTVDAYDLAGNYSGQSNPVVVSTPPLPGTLIYSVESDAYVSSVNTTSNYGRATTLRMDASPDVHSYLRFVVQGLAGNPIQSARLQIFSNTTSSLGFNVKEVLDNSWSEYSINYNNSPGLGNLITTSGSIASGSWVELDVTSYVTGEGIFSVGLDTTSSSAMSVGSRESGVNSALLLIDLQTNGSDKIAPTTPSGLAAFTNLNPLNVDLSWSPSIDNIGVVGYSIYRNGEYLVDVSGDALSFSDSTVLPLTDYFYTVSAFDLAGNHSPVSDAVYLSTPENQPPSVPTGLSAIVNETGAASISWSASTDNVGVNGYTLYRDDVILATLASTDLSFIDTTVTPGFSYSYSVDAFDQAGNRSERSTSVVLNLVDNQSPSTPSGLSASIVGTSQVELSWNPSTDNVEVIGYSVFRNGISIDTVTVTTLTYTDSSVSPNSEYSYTIDAFDQAGNHSTESDPAIVTLPDLPQVLTLTPEADAYVDASKPTTNYGNSTTLRADASPDLHAFLRFNIPDLGVKSISRAQLFFYANSNVRKDIQLLEVANNTWLENTIIYSNAPVLGNIVSSTSSVSAGSWAVFDVTSYINGSGDWSLGLVSTSSTSINLASRESGPNSPYLVLDLFTAVPDNTAPTTPIGLVVTAINSNQVDLTWSPSSDNVGVAGYTIYRDGSSVDTVSDTTLLYTDSSLSPNTEYSYSINAYDLAGNYSSVSAPVNVITPDIPDVLTITPEADAYVNSGSP